MPQANFEAECDRLSHVVDGALFARLRWERNEGPMIAHLVELAQGAIAERSEFEFTEEGATADIKRFVLKVHSKRVIAVTLRLQERQAVIAAEPIDRSNYHLMPGDPIITDFIAADEQWMNEALVQLFARVQPL